MSCDPAIGLLPSSGAQWDIQQFDFQDDEHLVLYSDGLIESEMKPVIFLNMIY